MSSGEMCENEVVPGPEWGRHGSPRAHTLGKRSHGLQEGFQIPPGPLGHHFLSKMLPETKKSLQEKAVLAGSTSNLRTGYRFDVAGRLCVYIIC